MVKRIIRYSTLALAAIFILLSIGFFTGVVTTTSKDGKVTKKNPKAGAVTLALAVVFIVPNVKITKDIDHYEELSSPITNDERLPIQTGDKTNNDNQLLYDAVCVVVKQKNASAAYIQRYLRIGYPKALALLNTMERLNYIGPLQDSLQRSVNISEQDLPAIAHFLKTNHVPLNVDNESHGEAQLGKVSYDSSHSILEAVDNMSSHGLDFELFTVDLLKKNGFEEAKATQGSGDYGIDVIAKKDGISYAIQCKCYSKPVGNKAVQEAYSGKSFYDCMIAVVFTNNYFTKAAKETAQRTNVLLWDRTKLIEFINNAEY